MNEWNLGWWLVVIECVKMCFVFLLLRELVHKKPQRQHLNRHMGGVGDTSIGNVDGFKAGAVWSLWSGQSSGCWGKGFSWVFAPCNLFCLFLTADIPWVCFALCCPGSRRTQSKDSEWTSESSPGGETQQQPDLTVWDAAGERALGRGEPGSVSSAASEVQKHPRKDWCPLRRCD